MILRGGQVVEVHGCVLHGCVLRVISDYKLLQILGRISPKICDEGEQKKITYKSHWKFIFGKRVLQNPTDISSGKASV